MTRKFFPAIAFATMVVAAGVVHGLYSDRWRASADVEDAIRRLDSVPVTVGDWHGEKQLFEEEDLRRAGIRGHAGYRYRNVVTGETLTTLIVCGRPGPILVHTPDVCYGGAGYVALGDRQRKEVDLDDGRSLAMWALRFKSPPSVGASQIEVSWAWNGGSGWKAPDNSRLAMSGHSVMYKLYVVRELPAVSSPQSKDPSMAFLRTYLPELEKILSR